MPLLVFDDPDMDLHDTGWGHVERPDRLRAARAAMTGLDGIEWCRPKFATRAELCRVHTPGYVDGLLVLHGQSRQLDADTVVSPDSIRAALLAAGAVQDAVDRVCEGPTRRALCLVRPPGHHALADRAMGFCLLNNVALGAVRALRRGLPRVLIVDWDVHHGNGTQALLEDRAEVLFCSLHQGGPFWPFTGRSSDRGPNGTVVNVPLPEGAGHDAILEAFDTHVAPAAEAFAPSIVLVSAGFDAHEDDPLGGLGATAATYAALTARVAAIADRFAEGRLVLVLEGGYSLRALGQSLRACARVLTGDGS